MSENLPVQAPEERQETENKKSEKKKKVTLIISIVVVAQVILAVFAGIYFFKRGYQNAKTNTTETIRREAYNTVYDISEGAHHTSNRALILLDDIHEIAELEVLQISTSDIYISDEEDKSRQQTIWYKMSGTGTYTVNLQMTEFIVDNERQHVLVKAPLPSITKFKEGKPEELLYHDERFWPSQRNNNVEQGELTAQKMLFKARTAMMKSLESNDAYFEAAKNSAVRLITTMIKSMNPSMKNLKVTVVFDERTGTKET